MTKPFFWIGFAVVLTAALFLGIRHEIDRSQRDLEKRLMAAIERKSLGAAVSTTTPTQDPASPEKLLEDLQNACEKIPALGTLPVALKKERAIADGAEAELLKLGDAVFATVESRFQKPGDLEFRRRLLRLLGKIDADRAWKLAEATFLREGEDYNVRWASAAVMRELDAEKAFPVLREFLLRHNGHSHPGLNYVVDTIREIGGHEAVQTLLHVMHDIAKELSVRNAAVQALGEMRAVEAYPALQDMVSENPSIYFRMNAARAIILVKPSEGCGFLRELQRVEKSPEFKQFLEQLLRDRCSS